MTTSQDETAVNDELATEQLFGRLRELARAASQSDDCRILEVRGPDDRATAALLAGVSGNRQARVLVIRATDDVPAPETSPGVKLDAFQGALSSDQVAYLDAPAANSLLDSQGTAINLLVLHQLNSYKLVAAALTRWLPYVSHNGIVVIGGHDPDSEVEAAVRDHLPFSHFLPLERLNSYLLLERTSTARSLYLCGGMQSGGTTLVSMCFLQRADMDGVYDMENCLIQQDFSRVFTSKLWIKMTVGSFRLKEVADLFSAQGWEVHPILVCRSQIDAMTSLITKQYGIDGPSGDDPPLAIRLSRYREDIASAKHHDWPMLDYEQFIETPEACLRNLCATLAIDWDEGMLVWPKTQQAIAYQDFGNASMNESLAAGGGLDSAIEHFRSKPRTFRADSKADLLIRRVSGDLEVRLSPVRFQGTRRAKFEKLNAQLEAKTWQLDLLRSYLNRLIRHPFLGVCLRLWVRFVNRSLAPPKEATQESIATVAPRTKSRNPPS